MSSLESGSKTILLGYFSRFWSLLLSFLLTPVYIKIIGVDSFAIVGLTFSIQAIFFFLDFGFGSATILETSELYAQKKNGALISFFKAAGIVYWGVALVLFLLFVCGSKVVTALWFSQVPLEDLERLIPLVGGVVLSQWPTLFYIAALWGLQRQEVVNRLKLFVATAKGGLTLAFLLLISPTIESFLLANILAGLLHSLLAVFCLKGSLKGGSTPARADFSHFWRIAKKSLKFSALSVLGILFLHIDKMVLGRYLDLHLFGYYSVAWILVYGMYGFCATLPAFFTPLFSWLRDKGEERKLIESYHQGCQWMSVLAFSGAVFFIFFADPLLFFWTRDLVLVENIRVLASLLIAGVCVNALTMIPQAFQSAHHWTSLSVAIHVGAIGVWIALMMGTVRHFGMMGVGIAWIGLHLVWLAVNLTLMHRRLLIGEKIPWLVHDVLKPCAGALAACALCRFLWGDLLQGVRGALLLGFTLLLTFLAGTWMAASIRPVAIAFVKRIWMKSLQRKMGRE